MGKKKYLIAAASFLGIFLLILDRSTALEGARLGLSLCIGTVIPVLLPFFILSSLLLEMLNGSPLTMLRPLGRLCRIPSGAEAILIPGFLGGYPLGARSIARWAEEGALSRGQAQRLLMFCTNAGPAFILGMLGPLFPRPWMGLSLWGIHAASALLLGAILPSPPDPDPRPDISSDHFRPRVMETALRSLALVCGWVICFRILSAFLEKWILRGCPSFWTVLISGLLELTGGCCRLPQIPDPGIRYILCAGLLGFGGICVAMQTASLLGSLSLMSYLKGKIIQSLLGMLFAASVITHTWPLTFTAAVFVVILARSGQKRCGNSRPLVV